MNGMLVCLKCGAKAVEGERFCSSCGAGLAPALSATGRCVSCSHDLMPSARFCPGCGAPTVVEPAQTPAAGVCANCDGPLAPDARFCAACGTPRPVPTAVFGALGCANCGAEMRPEAKFCRACGSPGGAPVASLPRAFAPAIGRPRSAASPPTISWPIASAALGFVLVVLSSSLAWASVLDTSVAPFDDDVGFRIADWVDNSDAPYDGLVALAIGAGGLAGVFLLAAGRVAAARGRSIIASIGALAIGFGSLQIQYIQSLGDGQIDLGFGIYVLMLGAILATVSSWLPNRAIGKPK